MLLNDLCDLAEKRLPAPLFVRLRRIANAFLTPFAFAYATGHFRSALAGKPMDRRGRPIPWYTYGAIEALRNGSYADRDVLELGAGQSTLWWSGRARSVLAFEADAGWHEAVRSRASSNVRLVLTTRELPDLEREVGERRFDVIVIDAFDRARCAERTLALLARDGMIVLDNSDANPAAVDVLQAAGLRRVDYFGPGPVGFTPFCTSLFLKQGCGFFPGPRPPLQAFGAWLE